MTIEEDISFVLPDHDGESQMERDNFAYRDVLQHFDQCQELIVNNQDVGDFATYDFVPPTLRKIIKEYCSGSMNQVQTLNMIEETRIRAGVYLKLHGCNAENEVALRESEHDAVMKKLEMLVRGK